MYFDSMSVLTVLSVCLPLSVSHVCILICMPSLYAPIHWSHASKTRLNIQFSWWHMVFQCFSWFTGTCYVCSHCVVHIRRPLPSFGLGGAAPGITAGVRHLRHPCATFSSTPTYSFYSALAAHLLKPPKLLSSTTASLPSSHAKFKFY
jgi:hypothetical protein